MMLNYRRVLSIGLGVLIGVLVSGCAGAASTGVGADSSQPTSRGAASSGAIGSSIGEGRDPVTQPTGTSVDVGGDHGAAAASSSASGGASPTGSEDAPVSSDDAVGASGATQTQGVDGKISDQEGHPVTGALVTPTSLDTPSKAIPEVAVITNDQGRYSWVLPTGHYRMTVTADGYRGASVDVEVPTSGTATLDLQLHQA